MTTEEKRIKPPKLADIAAAIGRHLKKWEADPTINIKTHGVSRLFRSHSYAAGKWVYVTYVSYQHASNLTRDEAAAYLTWIESGNVGTHYQFQRQILAATCTP